MRNPGGLRLHATFGSDIGHWDVPLMDAGARGGLRTAARTACIDADDLRDFVFTNPVRLWTSTNPHFFAGTVVEDTAAAVTRDRDDSVADTTDCAARAPEPGGTHDL